MSSQLIQNSDFVSQPELQDLPDDVITISIFGPESSGKSTLLNDLFSTRFETLESTTAKIQTTKGVIFDVVKQFLVLDIEGSDSVERQFEGQEISDKFAAFACAVGDIFIMNMWEHDVGRWQASGYATLEKVFKVYLQELKGNRSAIDLIFCVRDARYNGEGQRESEIRQIRLDIEQIWKKENQELSIEECFKLEFSFLPHREYEADKYAEAVATLRKYFFDHKSVSTIPQGMMGAHFEKLWSIILNNQELDLEREKQLIYQLKLTNDLQRLQDSFEETCQLLVQKPVFKPFELTSTQSTEKAVRESKLGQFIQMVQQNILNELKSQGALTIEWACAAGINVISDAKEAAINAFKAKIEQLIEVMTMEYKQNCLEIAKECFRDFHDGILATWASDNDNGTNQLNCASLGPFSEAAIAYLCLSQHFNTSDDYQALSIFEFYQEVADFTRILLDSATEGDFSADFKDFQLVLGAEFATKAISLLYQEEQNRLTDELEVSVISLIQTLDTQFYDKLAEIRIDLIQKHSDLIFQTLAEKGVAFDHEAGENAFIAPMIYPTKHLTRHFNTVIQTVVQTSADIYLLSAVRQILQYRDGDTVLESLNMMEAGVLAEEEIGQVVLPQLQLQIEQKTVDNCMQYVKEANDAKIEGTGHAISWVIWILLAFAARNDIRYVLSHKFLEYIIVAIAGIVIIENNRGRHITDYGKRICDCFKVGFDALTQGKYEEAAAQAVNVKNLLHEYVM